MIGYHSKSDDQILAKIKSIVLENRSGILERKTFKDISMEKVEEEARRFGEGRDKVEVASIKKVRRK